MTEAVHVLGAGSLGLLLAARLAPIVPVVLIRRPGDHAHRLELVLEEGGQARSLRIAQREPARLEAPVERLIVCTKAYDALAAVVTLRGRLAGQASLLLMQNGMGSQQAVAAALPGHSVYAASTTEGANRPAPRHVVHAGRGLTRIGRLGGGGHDWVRLFEAAGLAAEAAEPIDWHLANKLRVNALINPLTVLHDCRNGELLEHPERLSQLRELGEEADAVLAAAGYRFPVSALETAVQVARATAANVSSMLQDARAGRRLEVEYITGHLLRLAGETGVPAPAHREIYRRLASLL